MGLETGTYISDFNVNNPVNDTDVVGEGDDHIRLVKEFILNTFPNITGAMSLSHTQLNNAAQKNINNQFSADQSIETLAPAFTLFETDAPLDEGRYKFVVSGGALFGQARDDADAGGATWLQMGRTGTVVDTLDFIATDVRLRSGSDLELWDLANADCVEHVLDGTNYQINDKNASIGALRLRNMGLQIEDGQALRVQDATDADYWQTTHSGNSVLHDYVGTADVHHGFNNAPTQYYFFNGVGAETRMYLRRSGVDTGWLRATSSSFELRSLTHGGTFELRAEDAGGAARTMVFMDPDAAVRLAWGNESYMLETQDHDATGITSGATVVDHGGNFRDVGFNLLPGFDVDVSSTLAARHCGSEQRKTSATARTLTLAANTNLDFPVNGVTHISNENAAGNYTINEGTGTTLYIRTPGTGIVDTAGGCTLGPGGYATLKRISATVYHIQGTNLTP